ASIRELNGISARTQEEHYELYKGYVGKVNEIQKKLDAVDRTTANQIFSDLRSLRVDYSFAIGGMKNHEIFFGHLGGKGGAPSGKLKEQIARDFPSYDAWLARCPCSRPPSKLPDSPRATRAPRVVPGPSTGGPHDFFGGSMPTATLLPVIGKPAPDFTLPSTSGEPVSLRQFKGKKTVVLYFYPKDDTPGCTKEACDFRDHTPEIEAHGAVLFGVSTDGMESHQKFKAKHHLPFTLLSDEDATVSKQFGVYKQKNVYGKKS